jgi:hypothetical protein
VSEHPYKTLQPFSKGIKMKKSEFKVGMKCGYCNKWFKNADYNHWNNCRIKYTNEHLGISLEFGIIKENKK